jgi:hypothetical protein
MIIVILNEPSNSRHTTHHNTTAFCFIGTAAQPHIPLYIRKEPRLCIHEWCVPFLLSFLFFAARERRLYPGFVVVRLVFFTVFTYEKRLRLRGSGEFAYEICIGF